LSTRTKLLDRAGYASNSFVVVRQFDVGGMEGKNIQFMVSPAPQSGSNPNRPFDGVMAGDLLEAYDVEMNFADGKLNFFSKDHCDGRVVYWPAQAVAVVPYRTTRAGGPIRDTHIRVPVTLDGKALTALIDTGSARSTMSAAIAKADFHVTAESPDAVPLGTVANDPRHKVFGHVFGRLTFEGVAVNNPHIAIIPDLVGSKDPTNTLRTGSNVERVDDKIGPEITIGMDVLKKLRVYLASRERRLYLTPSSSTESAPAVQPTESGSVPPET
jgi:hypothetical protein